MFCDQSLLNNKNDLKCSIRLVSEIFAIISLVFSGFIVIVTLKKIKMNITNSLIIQIIISEIIDGLTILSAIPYELIGKHTFENYDNRMGMCFSQIYFAIFSCLWTLTSSFFISLRIFDRMVNKNKIFQKKFMANYTTTLSFLFSAFTSYILWTIQVTGQSHEMKEISLDKYYDLNRKSKHFRLMYCWVGQSVNTFILIIAGILIILNFIFSVFKGYCFIKKVSNNIKEATGGKDGDERRPSTEMKLTKMSFMMKSLISYPIISGIIWASFFALQIVINKSTDKNGIASWIYCIIISFRQLVYSLLFFFTQGSIRKYSISMLKCEGCRKRKNKGKDRGKKKKLLSGKKELINSSEKKNKMK